MSFSRNFAAIVNPDRDASLGHAYPNRHVLVQEKLQSDPVNNIYLIDNEIPHIYTEDEIFKINYPVGSIFITRNPIMTYGATLIQNTDPYNIRYLWHGCTFKYLYKNPGPDNVYKQTYLAGGEVKQNDDHSYTEKHSIEGGVNRKTISLIGDGYVRPHTLTIDQIPRHQHTTQINGWKDYRNGGGNHVLSDTGGFAYTYYSSYAGGGQPHSHSFNATTTVDINPPYFGVLFYERIQ